MAGSTASAWGAPQVRFATAQGAASSGCCARRTRCSWPPRSRQHARSWADALAICLDLPATRRRARARRFPVVPWADTRQQRGISGPRPALGAAARRSRLAAGKARGGGGWEASGADGPRGVAAGAPARPGLARGRGGRRPAIGFRIHDDDPNRWYSWPADARAPAPRYWSGRRRCGCPSNRSVTRAGEGGIPWHTYPLRGFHPGVAKPSGWPTPGTSSRGPGAGQRSPRSCGSSGSSRRARSPHGLQA